MNLVYLWNCFDSLCCARCPTASCSLFSNVENHAMTWILADDDALCCVWKIVQLRDASGLDNVSASTTLDAAEEIEREEAWNFTPKSEFKQAHCWWWTKSMIVNKILAWCGKWRRQMSSQSALSCDVRFSWSLNSSQFALFYRSREYDWSKSHMAEGERARRVRRRGEKRKKV